MDKVRPTKNQGSTEPKKPLVYLASPYTHPSEAVREARFQAVCMAAGRLMRWGYVVFSPIAHSHMIAKLGGLDQADHEFWMEQCLPMISKCDDFWIYNMPGSEESRGVRAEASYWTNERWHENPGEGRIGSYRPMRWLTPTPAELAVIEAAEREAA